MKELAKLEDKAAGMYKKKNKASGTSKDVDSVTTWGFVLSLIGIYFMFLFFIGAIFGIASIILGIVGLNRIKNNKNLKGKGFAIAAIVIGTIEVLVVLLIFAAFWFVAA